MLPKIIEFIDNYTCDKQLYWQVSRLYDKQRIEIMWSGTNHWRVKNAESLFWLEIQSADLIMSLNDNKVDIGEFERQIANTAVEQVVYAEMISDAGRELFTDDLIDEARRSYMDFKDELLKILNNTLQGPKDPPKGKLKLTVIKKDEEN